MKNSASLFTLVILFVLVTMSCGQGKTDKKAAPESSVENTRPLVAASPALLEQLRESALEGEIDGVKEALESGANVNSTDEEGHTALMFAAYNGHSEIVLELLGSGAGIDGRDKLGRTALLYAATGPFPETVRILLDKGAEPNVVDSDEHFSPLMHAAAEGHLDVVKILMEAGSDPALKDVDGDNAASFARQAGHTEVADYLDSL